MCRARALEGVSIGDGSGGRHFAATTAELQEARSKADGLVTEIEAARQVMGASENDMGEVLELAEALAKVEGVIGLAKQAKYRKLRPG